MNTFITKVHSTTDRERRIRHIWRASQLLLEQYMYAMWSEEANYRNVANSYKVRQSVSRNCMI